MLCDITATGCSVTALVAGYVAANPENPLLATASALSVFGFVLASSHVQLPPSPGGSANAAEIIPPVHRLAAELGAATARGPGSLRVNLIDCLYTLDEKAIVTGAKIYEAR
jgi:hydroxyethylthiazole kinase